MLVLKSAASALLAALFLALTTPTLLFQDAGPGKADDVAELLPEETLAFVELVRAPRLLKDWKEYVGSVTTADGKEKLCALIEDWFTKALEIVPEKLLKDLKEGLPSIQRLSVALTTAPREGIPWIFVATSSDPAFFKKLVDEDLKVFAAEEKAHQGVKVFTIRRMGDLRSPAPVFVASLGSRLLVTTHWLTMTEALDRASGKGTGRDLRHNRLYAMLSPAPAEDPALRGFSSYDWGRYARFMAGPFGHERMSRYMIDIGDAVVDFRGIPGAVIDATFKPGQVTSRLRYPVDPPCRLYDALRQPPGPKDLLGNLPKGTILFSHANLKSGKDVWASIEEFIKRFQEVERKAEPDHDTGDYLAEFEDEMKAHLGLTPKEAAALIGNELVVAFVEHEGVTSWELLLSSLLFMVRTTDAAKAKERVETMAAKLGTYTATTEGAMTLWVPGGAAGAESMPTFGIKDTIFALGFHDTVVRAALSAKPESSGAAAKLPKEASTASGAIGIRPGATLDLVLKLAGTEKPDPVKHLNFEDWAFLLWRTEKEGAELTSRDFGFGVFVENVCAFWPMAMIAAFSTMREMMPGGPGAVEPPPPVKERPEPPALPAAEVAKRVAEHVVKLRSEDVAVREKASGDLLALGKQAVTPIIAAYREEKDAEAKARLKNLLLEHKAWDALPELLDAKADRFIDELRTALGAQDPDRWGAGYATWGEVDEAEGPWAMEPYFVNEGMLTALRNGDLLSIPSGVTRYAERLRKADLKAEQCRQFAAVLAFHDCPGASEPILAMLGESTDAETKAFLTVALGWSDDAKAKEAVYKAFAAEALGLRRAAFLAAERMRDPEVVNRLFDTLKAKDIETRWNGGYTLGALTGGKLRLNAFLPDAEFEAQIQAAKKWWDENKAGFKLNASRSTR